MTAQTLTNLRAAVADGKLDDGELFDFAHVLFMHFRLKNQTGLRYHGEK